MLKSNLFSVIPKNICKILAFGVPSILIIGISAVSIVFYQQGENLKQALNRHILSSQAKEVKLKKQLVLVEDDLNALKNEDQYKINKKLEAEIKSIEKTYSLAVANYEKLLDLKSSVKNTQKLDDLFSASLKQLSERNYASAESNLTQLATNIKQEQDKLVSSFQIPANVAVSNSPPGSGYSRQQVQSEAGTFMVDIISADLSSTRVIVDTATDGDCRDNCPTVSLAEYVSRNGAFAGVNGSYFCPAEYPSCASKKNSFDLLVMNKNKKYLNSDNNVYSTNPAVIFGNGWVRFVGQALEWGRDTGVDGVISNFPLLLSGGNVTFGGNSDPKQGSKGSRSFVASKGNIAYIGVVHNATVAEVARVLKALGLENAMNLDSGGSTALWHGGYRAGPGRNIANAILFVRK